MCSAGTISVGQLESAGFLIMGTSKNRCDMKRWRALHIFAHMRFLDVTLYYNLYTASIIVGARLLKSTNNLTFARNSSKIRGTQRKAANFNIERQGFCSALQGKEVQYDQGNTRKRRDQGV